MTEITEIKAQVAKFNGTPFDDDDINDQAAATLLSILEVGDKIRTLAGFTGFPQRTISDFVHRLRNNGVLKGGKVYANWADPETGGIAFGCDVLVASGRMRRA